MEFQENSLVIVNDRREDKWLLGLWLSVDKESSEGDIVWFKIRTSGGLGYTPVRDFDTFMVEKVVEDITEEESSDPNLILKRPDILEKARTIASKLDVSVEALEAAV